MPDEPTPHRVPAPFDELILRLHNGWKPDVPIIWEPEKAKWGDFAIAPTKLRREQDAVYLRVPGSVRPELHLQSRPLEVLLESNHVLSARSAVVAQAGFDFQYEGGSPYYELTTSGDWWVRPAGNDAVAAYVARLRGFEVRGRGNLVTEYVAISRRGKREHWGFSGLRLDGQYGYYVVKQAIEGAKAECYLVVDVRGAPQVDVGRLSNDLTCLECAIGRSLRIEDLIVFCADLRPVGLLALWWGKEHRERHASYQLVPPVDEAGLAWEPVFFARLSAMIGQASNEALAAVRHLADALDDHVDGRYLKTRIAIEALTESEEIRSHLRPGMSLVRDKEAWVTWVRESQAAIRDLAGQDSERLMTAMEELGEVRSRNVVEEIVLETLGDVPEEVQVELQVWDGVLKQGVISTHSPRDLKADVRRMFTLRGLLGLLLAKAIGYGGPVYLWAGAEDEPFEFQVAVAPGVPASQDEDEQEARRIYTATGVIEEGADERPFWAQMGVPRLPDDRRIAPFIVAAAELQEKTSGCVIARLIPVARRRPKDPLTLSFKLMLARNRTIQSVPFSLRLKGRRIEISGWGEEASVVGSEEDARRMMHAIAESEDMRFAIERLITLGDELYGGAA